MSKIQKFISRKRKYVISILISLLIISISIVSLIKINVIKEESNYIANKGIIDLKDWNVNEEEIIKLDGEWEFYSGEFFTSIDEADHSKRKYVEVPGSWESYLDGKGLENISGTYRLNIKVPEEKIYALKAKTIRVSNRIYINGVEVASAGNPSLNRNLFKSGSQYNIGIGNSVEGNVDLIIHVTSSPNKSGGIYKSIMFGTVDTITKATDKSTILDAFVVSVCLVLGLYFFLIYLQRHKESYLAYYSGASLSMAIFFSTVNEQILRLIYDYDFIARTRIQIVAMIMITFCFIRFIHSYFKDYSIKKTGDIISGLMLSNLIFVFINDKTIEIFSLNNIFTIIMIFMTISFAYIFIVLIKAMIKNIELTEYILVIITSMFSYWFIAAFKTIFESDLGNISVMLILFTMFGVAALVSHRLQLDYQQARDISEKMIRYDRLKDDFLIKSSRELKMPLQNIIYSLKQLLEGEKGSLNEEQQKELLLILHEGKGLIRLSEDLQDASLIKRDGSNIIFAPVEPFKIVEAIIAEIQMVIPLNGQVILQNEIPKDFPLIYADSDKFRQILYDLIHNAIKYTKMGKIAISAAIMEEQAQITVSDTGIGIEEKYLKEVFDKFFQKGEEGQVNKGLGLGLSIVKHLVEIQGGKIKVRSIHGKGSDFIFTLPLYDKNIGEEKEMNDNINRYDEISSFVRENKGIELDNINILIVDDDLANQKILSGIIRELNYNVITGNTGNEAITILKDNRIDLIIIDFMLPDMAASHLCSEIRKTYSMVELPILILTQSGRTVDRINTFYFGANDFQKKPINSEELKSRIESLLLMKTSAERALEKEFQYFYSQISPHFLYNTLNSIIGISYIDGDKAREGLNNLAVYFRGKLDIHRKKGLVSLESELELVSAYLGIEGIRYGDKLQVEYDIEDNLSAMIPPLSLQTIIENSVNHGLAVKENGGKIKISAKRYNNDFIKITIEDNGKGMDIEKQEELIKGTGKGIGFKNVMERIKIIKGASLVLTSELNQGTKIEIIIPGVKDYENHID